MAIQPSATTLFDLAEKQMFDTVCAKVKRDFIKKLTESFVEVITKKIDDELATYATSEIRHMEDHLSMKQEFIIWLKRDGQEQERVDADT